MKKQIMFNPEPDISVFELALIVGRNTCVTEDKWRELPIELRRHFKGIWNSRTGIMIEDAVPDFIEGER